MQNPSSTPKARVTYQRAGKGDRSIIDETGGDCPPSADVNVTVLTAYNADGNVSSVTALNASTSSQVTQYIYGTTLADSDIASTLLKSAEILPDSLGGSDQVVFAYNRQGQVKQSTDQNGTVHQFEYDKLGRQIHDRVTTLGTGVDNAVLRLSTTYEVRGMAATLTSWNNASVTSGDVVNQCQFVYNSFRQLTADYQEHGGAVNTGTTPKVQYAYADGSANTIRPTTMTYPNGRVLTYGYGSSGGINDASSRIASLIDNDVSSTHLADYSFVGLGSFVIVNYTEPNVQYTLVSLTGTNDPDTGDIYTGFDRFGRVKDCRWYNTGASTDVVRLKYGYDRASDRLWRQDLVAQSLGKDFDELYSYDGLHRLQNMQRGQLSSDHSSISSETFAQCWTLDSTSNWSGFREASSGGSWTTVQFRTANHVNEITAIANIVGSSWANPAYDAAGNATTFPKPDNPATSYTATYDAWNRMVEVVNTTSSNTVQQNQYDARNFRTSRADYTSGTLSETRHYFNTSEWQTIEERLGTSPDSAAPERQQVWGQRYVDDLVLRDRSPNGDWTLDERFYGLQDANWNAIALIDATAIAQERYLYSPFGWPTFLNGTFSIVLATSVVDSDVLFTGQRHDGLTLLYLFRNRYFVPLLGSWIRRDPSHLATASQLYEFSDSNPLINTDVFGLTPCEPSLYDKEKKLCMDKNKGANRTKVVFGCIHTKLYIGNRCIFDRVYSCCFGPCQLYMGWCVWGARLPATDPGKWAWTLDENECLDCGDECALAGGKWGCAKGGGKRRPEWPSTKNMFLPVWDPVTDIAVDECKATSTPGV